MFLEVGLCSISRVSDLLEMISDSDEVWPLVDMIMPIPMADLLVIANGGES
jgi:hypothetical protein